MADTHTIPKPIESIAKPQSAQAAVSSGTAALDVLDHVPDGVAQPALSPGDADELIARMADAQIDLLLADEEAGRPPAPTPPPSIDVKPPAPSLASLVASPVAEPSVLTAPIETLALPDTPMPASAEPAFPASFSPPSSKRSQPAPFADEAVIASPIDAPLPPLPPLPAEPMAIEPPPAAEPAHELQSSADAVARELAADLLRTPPRAAASHADPHEAAPAEPVRADGEVSGLRAIPVVALDVLNYPVRALSDNAREVMGAIAIVTLANATALLIYLVMFRT